MGDEPMDTDISDNANKVSATTDTTSQVPATVLTSINSCKEILKNIPKEKESSGQSSTPKVEEPLEELSTREENARIAREAYHFEENPIFIPENLKHRVESTADEPLVKKPRTDFEESTEIRLDTETMMKDFVLD